MVEKQDQKQDGTTGVFKARGRHGQIYSLDVSLEPDEGWRKDEKKDLASRCKTQERGGQGREPDLWPEPSSPCLGNLWRFTALPRVLPFRVFGRRPRSREDFGSSISGYPYAEASLLQNEKRKPRPAGGVGGRMRRVATAWKPQRPRGRSPRGAEPDLNFSASEASPEPTAARMHPLPPATHTGVEPPLYPRPREPSTAGPQPPPPPAARPPAGRFLRLRLGRAKGSSAAQRPQLRLPEGHDTLSKARNHLRRPLPKSLHPGEGHSSGFWKPSPFAPGETGSPSAPSGQMIATPGRA
ncbi:unnamed protein product [Rangifer tarandus platyrhynchus]|uniref:Uncharacterized protein n=2 Tax=Rangifer tarandus platyrhynchus TaxID=3082113 RepID=A0ABN8YSS1_RANTA|nr:unnamed protein product [Rangifer tarandus platyrhynchus]CAI9702247.1 unnamed protein product [Rangifer tarandus platyrhynchus]